jgi:hypothetical protein
MRRKAARQNKKSGETKEQSSATTVDADVSPSAIWRPDYNSGNKQFSAKF